MLRRFGEPINLLDWLHHADAGPDAKNAILRDLVFETQAGDIATVLLYLALWPGLDAVYRRLQRYFRRDPDLLVSELSGQFAEQVATLNTDRVRRIAATVLMNIERDIRRSLITEANERRNHREMATANDPRWSKGGAAFVHPVGPSLPQDSEIMVERLRPIIGRDASLVVDVNIVGYTLNEIADRDGRTYDATRKRYQRARSRLRKAWGNQSGTSE